MPSQRVNDSTTEASAGTQTNARSSSVGIADHQRAGRPCPAGSSRRTARRAGAAPAGRPPGRGVARVVAIATADQPSAKIDFFCSSIDFAGRSTSLGFLMNVCSDGIITVRGEVGPRVAVHELGDVLRAGDELGRLLLQRRCSFAVSASLAAATSFGSVAR